MPRKKLEDPKINAGISLRKNSELRKIEEYAKAAGLESTSAVVSLLIEKCLPYLWYELEFKKSKK